MGNEQAIVKKGGGRKRKRIGKKVGNVVVIMQAISVVFAVTICVYMYNSLVRSMQKQICTNGTNALAYELSRVSEEDDINQILDGMKERMGCEFTIFEGDTRAYSTVTKNGERVVGTKLASNLIDIVLKKGQSYVGEADILGETYLCSYVPTKGENGQIEGLIFAGISMTEAKEETARIITYAAVISVAVIIVCILFLLVYLKKGVSGPLAKITQAAMRLEKGELGLADGEEVKIGVRSNDEIGLLGEIFEGTVTSLRAYIGEISDILGAIAKGDLTREAQQDYTGDFLAIKKSLDSILGALNQTMGQIAASANHVSASAQTLAQGATEQASAVTEISTTITDISASAKETSIAAEEVGRITNQAGTQLGVSMENVKELSVSMERIASDSKQISTIIATIENIAFQINILSLNAAVEAARAGSAGKGFAVVAEEISSLASKSDEAAKATKELIESSAATITEGGKVMNRVSEALERTGELAGNVTVKMEQVVEAVEKQTIAMEQVATGVEQISAVVENNSATSQECAAASQELSSQSGMLKELIGAFRLKNARWQ